MNGSRSLLLVSATLAATLSACTPAVDDGSRAAIDSLAAELATQRGQIAGLSEKVEVVAGHTDNLMTILDGQAELSTEIKHSVEELAARPAPRCEIKMPTAAAAPKASADEVRTVPVQDDKMVMGALEKIWIDPPGFVTVARVDSGAESSSMHAEDIVEFERDGDNWVRFLIFDSADSEGSEVERKIARHVRVLQASDPNGTRRPVVRMRVGLGSVHGYFDFTLADRGHLDQEVLLGRNFLTDVAVVDVAKTFVQKAFDPSKRKADEKKK